MAQLILQVPDELAERLELVRDRLPELRSATPRTASPSFFNASFINAGQKQYSLSSCRRDRVFL
jgi:hypothetical protein